MSNLKQYSKWIVGSAALASALALGAFGIAGTSRDAGFDSGYDSDSDYSEDHDSGDNGSDYREDRDSDDDDSGYSGGKPGTTAVASADPAAAMYRDECGACHVAYPPGLLPSESWQAIMTGLDDHFGENAELTSSMNARLTAFLDNNASNRGDRLKHARLLRDVETDMPLRITGLPYFRSEHNEIPRRLVEDNPQVISMSNCDTCHRDAARGRFDEDTVSIPGADGWSD